MLNRRGFLSDQELRLWQQFQVNKCRFENVYNKVVEISNRLQNPTELEPAVLELEESAISSAIAAYGLVGSLVGNDNDETANHPTLNVNGTQQSLFTSLFSRTSRVDLMNSLNQIYDFEQREPPPQQHNSSSSTRNTRIQRRRARRQQRQQFLQDAVSTAIKNKGLEPKG